MTYLLLLPGYLALCPGLSLNDQRYPKHHLHGGDLLELGGEPIRVSRAAKASLADGRRCELKDIPDRQVKVDVQTLVCRVDLKSVRGHGHAVQVDVGWSDPLWRGMSGDVVRKSEG